VIQNGGRRQAAGTIIASNRRRPIREILKEGGPVASSIFRIIGPVSAAIAQDRASKKTKMIMAGPTGPRILAALMILAASGKSETG